MKAQLPSRLATFFSSFFEVVSRLQALDLSPISHPKPLLLICECDAANLNELEAAKGRQSLYKKLPGPNCGPKFSLNPPVLKRWATFCSLLLTTYDLRVIGRTRRRALQEAGNGGFSEIIHHTRLPYRSLR